MSSSRDRLVDAIAERVVKQVRGADLRDRTLGFGRPEDGQKVGKQKAVYAQVNLTGADLTAIDVGHALGVVPTRCDLVEWENTADPTTVLASRPVGKDKWTASNCRVYLTVVAGTQAGTLATFLVGGE